MWAQVSFDLSQFTRLTSRRTEGRTDRQTDRQTDISLVDKTALHRCSSVNRLKLTASKLPRFYGPYCRPSLRFSATMYLLVK